MKPTSPECFFSWLLLVVEQMTNNLWVFHSLLQSWGSCLVVSALVSRPHPSDRRRGRDEHQYSRANSPMNINRINADIKFLKHTQQDAWSIIPRCIKHQHTAEATHIHCSIHHVHLYSFDINVIAEMEQQQYLSFDEEFTPQPATSLQRSTQP